MDGVVGSDLLKRVRKKFLGFCTGGGDFSRRRKFSSVVVCLEVEVESFAGVLVLLLLCAVFWILVCSLYSESSRLLALLQEVGSVLLAFFGSDSSPGCVEFSG